MRIRARSDARGRRRSLRISMAVLLLTAASGLDTSAARAAAAAPLTTVAMPGILAPPDQLVGEADGSVGLTVSLTDAGSSTVTVDYTTVSISAGIGPCNSLIQNASGTLTFLSGTTTQTVQVTLNNCHVAGAGLSSFRLNLSNAQNGTIVRPSTRIGIVGDPNPTVASPLISVRGATVDNSAGTTAVTCPLGRWQSARRCRCAATS